MEVICSSNEQPHWKNGDMNEEAQRFLHELEKALVGEAYAKEIVHEYRMHLNAMLSELESNESMTYKEIVDRLGTPEELAALWKEEKSVTPKNMQRLFVFLNIALFLGGALFTVGYNVLEWQWLDDLWKTLTESTTFMLFIYLFFWGLLGYEIGKAFGARGKKVLNRTFIICVIPNIVFMSLVLFRFIPSSWLDALPDGPFIIVCILGTIGLYPISLLGYRWGKKQSV